VGETVTVIDPVSRHRKVPIKDGKAELIVDETPVFACAAGFVER
jgi:hypothetical protein